MEQSQDIAEKMRQEAELVRSIRDVFAGKSVAYAFRVLDSVRDSILNATEIKQG